MGEGSAPTPERPKPPAQAVILAVDDVVENRKLLRSALGRVGYHVVEAATGAAALALAKSEQPDLILMDVKLPDIDGMEVAAFLKKDPATRHIPVVAVTAYSMQSDRDRAARAGCSGFLAKPVEIAVLREEVRRQLERRGTVPEAPASAAQG